MSTMELPAESHSAAPQPSRGDERYPALYRPGKIGTMVLRNRFVQSPIFTQFADSDGEIGERFIDYHRARARGGVGLIITENTSVDWKVGRTVGHPMRIDHDRYISGLQELVEAVHNEGAKIAVQLHHTGRQNSRKNTETNEPPIAPTAGITSAFGTSPREIDIDEIPGLIEMYASGARRAVAAGFDAVEIHGAHGYLPGQFLSPKTNKRTDEYGGSLENRARFALELVRAVRSAVGSDFPVLYRLSVEEPYEGGLTLDDGLEFCKMLEPNVDALDVSAGNYDTATTLIPFKITGSLLHYAKKVKEIVSVPVIGVGRLAWRLDDCQDAVEAGETDFIAFGRSGLADPETVTKTQRGQEKHVRRCLAVNECISRWMFAGQRTQCIINPALGQERRADEAKRPAAVSKSIAVVGAGPAGSEAAILAAERGHNVTIFDRAPRVGGQLSAWATSPVMATEIDNLIGFYEAELESKGVTVRLNHTVSPEDVATFDVVLLATGTDPASARPEGSLDAVEMLQSKAAPDGQAVEVFGSTETAAHAALWLAGQGKRVSLTVPGEDIAEDTNDMLREQLRQELTDAGVTVQANALVPSGSGQLIWAQERSSNGFMAAAVDGERILEIGTRFRGGRLYEATQSGFWTAARI
jgi:2,4-dienoyl-CoA reductase-like NADH-dependent reductase (Old Yellow Enzyme family)